MEVCAFVLVAPLSIPTVSLDALASLCRDYLASAPDLVTAACLALRPPLLRPPAHVAAPGPLCAVGKEADSILSLGAARAPQLCAGSQILCGPGKPIRGPALASLLQVHPPGRGAAPAKAAQATLSSLQESGLWASRAGRPAKV